MEIGTTWTVPVSMIPFELNGVKIGDVIEYCDTKLVSIMCSQDTFVAAASMGAKPLCLRVD